MINPDQDRQWREELKPGDEVALSLPAGFSGFIVRIVKVLRRTSTQIVLNYSGTEHKFRINDGFEMRGKEQRYDFRRSIRPVDADVRRMVEEQVVLGAVRKLADAMNMWDRTTLQGVDLHVVLEAVSVLMTVTEAAKKTS